MPEAIGRLLSWRHLLIAGAGAGAMLALGSLGAFADDGPAVQQSNVNTVDVQVSNQGAQSNGLIAGPIVVPIAAGVGANVAGPVNANVASTQTGSGNTAAIRQQNVNVARADINNQGASSNGLVAGPIAIPVAGQVGANVAGPVNANALSTQTDSGNVNGGISQLNANGTAAEIDNQGASSNGLVAGPIAIPVGAQVGANVAGPVNANVLSTQQNSGNVTDPPDPTTVDQTNLNVVRAAINNNGATSNGVVAGPIAIPIGAQVGANVVGPVNANLLSNQTGSGNIFGDVVQRNSQEVAAAINNNGATSNGVVAGPIAIPVGAQVGANVAGPLNLNVLSSQTDSGNICGTLRQNNTNHLVTFIDNAGSTSNGLIAGPVAIPVGAAAGLNIAGPANINVLSQQRRSGNIGPCA